MKNILNGWFKAYIIDVLPIVSLFVYTLGFTYTISYYMVFNLNVIPFISLYEILIPTISVLSISLFGLLVALISNKITKNAIEGIENIIVIPFRKYIVYPLRVYLLKKSFYRARLVDVRIKMERGNTSKNIRYWIDIQYIIWFITVAFLLLSISYLVQWLYEAEKNISWVYLLMAVSLTLFIDMTINVPTLKQIPSKVGNIIKVRFRIFLCSLLIICTFLFGYFVAEKVIENPPKEYYEIFTEKEVLKTDSTLILIGESSLAIFLYDKVQDESIIINRDAIYKISQKTRFKDRYKGANNSK